MVRWGILSTGAIANDFTLALKKTLGAEVAAVGSRSAKTAEAFAVKHNIPKAYSTYEELVSDPSLDIIYVATPHSHHHENVMQCLNAGKNVLCEKPMCPAAWQTRECIAAARKQNVFLMEGMWTRFFPVTRRVMEAIRNGEIGEVVSVAGSFGFKYEPEFNERLSRPELAGGSLLDVGVYPLLWSMMVLGKPVKVSAMGRLMGSGVDEHVSVNLEFENKKMAQIQCGFLGSMPNEMHVTGTHGVIRIPRLFHVPESFTVTRKADDDVDPLLSRGVSTETTIPHDPPGMALAPGYNFVGSQGFVHQALAVQEALKEGKKEHPLMPLDETQAAVDIMDEIRRQIGVKYPFDR